MFYRQLRFCGNCFCVWELCFLLVKKPAPQLFSHKWVWLTASCQFPTLSVHWAMKNLRVILGLALNIWICPLPEFVFTFNTVAAKAQQKSQRFEWQKSHYATARSKEQWNFLSSFFTVCVEHCDRQGPRRMPKVWGAQSDGPEQRCLKNWIIIIIIKSSNATKAAK